MDTNKLSLRLLAEGWTKDQTPPGCHPWNGFYGGWTYDLKSRWDCVFETPCGLLYRRSELPQCGTMSVMGIDWTEENDCLAILCPRYSRTEPCQLNHPLLNGFLGHRQIHADHSVLVRHRGQYCQFQGI